MGRGPEIGFEVARRVGRLRVVDGAPLFQGEEAGFVVDGAVVEAAVSFVAEHSEWHTHADERAFALANPLLGERLPGVANVLDIVRVPGTTAVVQQAAPGVSVEDLLRAALPGEELPLSFVLRVGLDVARAQQALATTETTAHPRLDDVRIDWRGRVTVTPRPWKTTAMIERLSGTAPEIVRALPRRMETRVYGVGAVLWGLLAGRPPVEGHGQMEVLMAVLDGRLVPLPERVAPELRRLVEGLCAVEPGERRPRHVDDVVTLLERRVAAEGGDGGFGASLVAERFAERKAQEEAWLEELALQRV